MDSGALQIALVANGIEIADKPYEIHAGKSSSYGIHEVDIHANIAA